MLALQPYQQCWPARHRQPAAHGSVLFRQT